MSDRLEKVPVADFRRGNLPPANLDIPMPPGAAIPPDGGGEQSGDGSSGGGDQAPHQD
jgi:hypothetical protein